MTAHLRETGLITRGVRTSFLKYVYTQNKCMQNTAHPSLQLKMVVTFDRVRSITMSIKEELQLTSKPSAQSEIFTKWLLYLLNNQFTHQGF